jgi:hypothetical protein
MASFLNSLGAFGAGAAPGIADFAQQMNNNALGDALASLYGGGQAAPQQSAGPMGSISTLLQGLGGGMNAPSPQLPAMQQTSIPQGPRAPMPANAPLTANVGGGTPAQQQAQAQQPAPAMPQQQPQTPPPPPPPPQAPRPQPQQQQAPQSSGPLDIPTLVKSLTAHGITGHKLVDALHTAVPLLNAQGLQQYRDLGLQLRAQEQANRQAERQFQDNPDAPGSRASARVNNQQIARQRLQQRADQFKARQDAALEKLKNAKTDKEAKIAKDDLDRIAVDLRTQLQAELNIINSPGTSPADQKAAAEEVARIRQQLDDATSEAIKARRSGGASGDQVGGIPGAEKSAPAAGAPVYKYRPDGVRMKYKGSGDQSDPANWEEARG